MQGIVIHSLHTDVIILIMSFKYLGSLYMKTGTKNRTCIINNDSCERGIGYNVSEALIVLWLLKCCDTDTSLSGKGKL